MEKESSALYYSCTSSSGGKKNIQFHCIATNRKNQIYERWIYRKRLYKKHLGVLSYFRYLNKYVPVPKRFRPGPNK